MIVGPKTPRGKGRKKQVIDADRSADRCFVIAVAFEVELTRVTIAGAAVVGKGRSGRGRRRITSARRQRGQKRRRRPDKESVPNHTMSMTPP